MMSRVPSLTASPQFAWLTPEIVYVLLLFTLFILPKFLQRFRIPSAVTALAFGAIAGPWLGLVHDDATVNLLSTLGIVSLFLFAGLDVEPRELRQEARVLSEHVVVKVVALAAVAGACAWGLGIGIRPALLVALAVMTPSTGFILDSLAGWGSSESERFWIRATAIGTELVALAVLFVAVQSTSLAKLGVSALAMAAMVALLPIVFRWFAKVMIPFAPKSEFGFLILVAATCAIITRNLGVYYLVGAFVVGMAAQQFRGSLPALASQRMIGAVEAFASLFVPFYFFHAGTELVAEDFSWTGVATGAGLIAVLVPFRIALVAGHRALRLGEGFAQSRRIAVAMLPTTVFALVIVDILRTRFDAPAYLLGGLVVYTVVTTLIPGFIFRMPTPEFEDELLLGEDRAAPAAGRSDPLSS